MRRIIVGSIVLGLVALIVTTTSVAGVVPVTPYEADVDKSGGVNAIDLMQVAQRFGQPVPAPTPSAPASTYVAVFEYQGPSGVQEVNIDVYCDSGDPVTGGGVGNATVSLGDLSQTIPIQSGLTSGWRAHFRSVPNYSSVYAVCLDNPPLRQP